MSETPPPTLEDLRDHAAPAWLWDIARGRAVWANAPGLDFFGCETLFDLIDRPFDRKEPGIERLAALGRDLKHGQARRALLSFPSTGAALPIACTCHAHALSDGRIGVLAIGTAPGEAQPAAAAEDVVQAFDLLPTAALIAAGDGGILQANEAARELLPAHRIWSFGGLIDDERRAGELLSRVALAGTVSIIARLPVQEGERDLRITLRQASRGKSSASRILILLDDITVRRALERQMQPPAPVEAKAPSQPKLTAEDEAAFAAIGQALNGAAPVPAIADAALAPAAEPSPAPSAEPPPKPAARPLIPAFVTGAIEARRGAHVIVASGAVVYANAEAVALLGFASRDELLGYPALSTYLSEGPEAMLPTGDGGLREMSVARTPIPWFNGPAECFTLTASPQNESIVEPPLAPEAPELRLAEPAPPVPKAESLPEPVPEPAPALEPASAEVDASDEELRAILDTASDGIVTLDTKGRIRSLSAGAEAIFGYRTAEVADKLLADLMAPESRRPLRDYLSALDGPGLTSLLNDGREVSAVVKQGGEVPLFMTIGKLQSPKPGGAAFCAVVRDITQWKKTERELREARDTAEQASRQKSEFLAKISHELRTPLNAILGFSEVMRLERFGEIRNDKYRGYISDIHASGGHLLALINDLLDLSKIESGNLELNFTSVNLGEAAENAIRLTQEQATAGRVIVRKSFPPGLPNVVADLRSIRQILLNLLSNAIKFTDPGGQVIVSAQMAKLGELSLRIKDTGIGMSEAEVTEALEPFRRIVTEGRERQGTGLGLPLTKALAEANRAAFSIASEPRKGTLVEIVFPVTRVLAE